MPFALLHIYFWFFHLHLLRIYHYPTLTYMVAERGIEPRLHAYETRQDTNPSHPHGVDTRIFTETISLED